jgi:hypothetical protein
MKNKELISRVLLMSFILLYSLGVLPFVSKVLLAVFLLLNYLPALIVIFKANKIVKDDWESVIAAFAMFFLILPIVGIQFWTGIILAIVIGCIFYYLKFSKKQKQIF